MGVYNIERFKAVVDQDKIHRMARSEKAEIRNSAVYLLHRNFSDLRQQSQKMKKFLRMN